MATDRQIEAAREYVSLASILVSQVMNSSDMALERAEEIAKQVINDYTKLALEAAEKAGE